MTDGTNGRLFENGDEAKGEAEGEPSDGHAAGASAVKAPAVVRAAPEIASMPRPGLRPARAVRRVVPGTVAPPAPAAAMFVWGSVPPKATAWGVERLNARDDYEELAWSAPGHRVEGRIWPLAELNEAEIAARWGTGTYRIHWYNAQGTGGRRHLSWSKSFTVKGEELPAAAAAAVASPSAPQLAAFSPELQQTLLMMQTLDGLATGKLAQLAQLGQVLGGGNQTALLHQLMAKQQADQMAMFERMMQEQRADREANLRVMRELVAADNAAGDEEGNPAGRVAGAVARAVVDPDASVLDSLKSMAAADPVEAMKTLQSLFQQVPSLVAAAKDFLPKQAPPAAPSPPQSFAPPPAPLPSPPATPRRVQGAPRRPAQEANGAPPPVVSALDLARGEALSKPPAPAS